MEKAEVKLFALSTCGACAQIKAFLDANQVEYTSDYLDLAQGSQRDALAEEVKKLNPAFSFPTLLVNGKVVVGFRENLIKEALGL